MVWQVQSLEYIHRHNGMNHSLLKLIQNFQIQYVVVIFDNHKSIDWIESPETPGLPTGLYIRV